MNIILDVVECPVELYQVALRGYSMRHFLNHPADECSPDQSPERKREREGK